MAKYSKLCFGLFLALPELFGAPRLDTGETSATARGYRELYGDWDIGGAVRSFREAIRANPRDPAPRIGYSESLTAAARHAEAVAEAEGAVRVDHASALSLANYGRALFFAARYKEAAVQLLRSLKLREDSLARVWLARSYDRMGRHDLAIAQDRIAIAAPGSHRADAVASLGCSLAGRGDTASARAILGALEEQGGKAAFGAATVAAAIGEHDRAFRSLERAVVARSESIPFLAVDPHLEALREDARFRTLLSRIQLEPERAFGLLATFDPAG